MQECVINVARFGLCTAHIPFYAPIKGDDYNFKEDNSNTVQSRVSVPEHGTPRRPLSF